MTRESLTTVKKILQQAGYKLTPQRELTLMTLVERANEHLSAEEIYVLLKGKNPDIGLATVYRTLDILTELGITYRSVFDDGLARYDLKISKNKHAHHYLLCLSCGKIETISDDLLLNVEDTIKQKYHFEVLDHRLTFYGICEDCQKNKVNHYE